MTIELFCRLYLDAGQKEQEEVTHDFEEILMSKSKTGLVENNFLSIFVDRNKFYDKNKVEQEDGFMYYPYSLEIYPGSESIEEKDHIENMKGLLEEISRRGWRYVASCDYEEELPKSKV